MERIGMALLGGVVLSGLVASVALAGGKSSCSCMKVFRQAYHDCTQGGGTTDYCAGVAMQAYTDCLSQPGCTP